MHNAGNTIKKSYYVARFKAALAKKLTYGEPKQRRF